MIHPERKIETVVNDFSSTQDEKNQLLTTCMWLQLVSVNTNDNNNNMWLQLVSVNTNNNNNNIWLQLVSNNI